MKNPVYLNENISSYTKFRELLKIYLHPKDLQSFWSRCGLTADYGASFLALCFPKMDIVRNSLSTILNEIVENAVKYTNSHDNNIEIILLHNKHDYLIFDVRNYLSTDRKHNFKTFIEEIQECNDLEEKYIQKLQYNSEHDTSYSGLGILTILNNFDTEMAFHFDTAQEQKEQQLVSVQVKVNLKGLI